MELVLKDTGSEVLISDVVFGSVFNEPLVHQVVTSCLLNYRQGTCAQKSRSEVSGSGRKPWRQKGTGRARSGSIRSPIWRSGGVTFASKPKIYKIKINKKMYRGALKSIFSEFVRQNRLILVSEFHLETSKTKLLIERLKNIGLENNLLILVNESDRNLFLASRNLCKVKVCHLNNLDPYILMTYNKVLMTVQVVKSIEGILN